MADFRDKVRSALKDIDFANGTVIVAVSGGPDSVALLRVLLELRQPLNIGRLGIAHVNHQLRGADSDADEAFVHDLYQQLNTNYPYTLLYQAKTKNIAELAEQTKQSLETTARQVRYEWFPELAEPWHSHYVATGHTANDQAETVLHRILRGTGLKGLRGIPCQRPLTPTLQVFRPLLRHTRAEILTYLDHLDQPYRHDDSNTNLQFTRNRLRTELLPHLAEHYNSAIVDVLCRLAQQADDIYQDEEAQAQRLLQEAELPRAGDMVVLRPQPLTQATLRLLRAMFRLLWEREGWPLQEMGFEDWQRVVAVTQGEQTAVDLPGKIRVQRRKNAVQLLKR